MPSLPTKPRLLAHAIRTILASLVCACGGESGPEATFTVTDGAQATAAVPWPSDLLRDDSGHVAVSALPLDDTVLTPALIDDLNHEQDGFGLTSGAYFPVGRYLTTSFGAVMADDSVGAVDPATLDGNVHLLPLTCADGHTPDQVELPVFVTLRAEDKPQRIYAKPYPGVVLRERCTYAYVITTKVQTGKGALSASEDLRALLSSSDPPARLQKAYSVFAPLRARLASVVAPDNLGALTPDNVADATVFTTHTVTADYLAGRAALSALPTPKATVTYVFARTKTAADDGTLDDLLGTPATEQPGEDVAGGVAHGAIEYVIQGYFDTGDFLGGGTKNATGVESTAVGVIERDAGGKPRIKGTISVPFTLVIPAGADLAALKFAVVQHGLGAERVGMLTVTNTLAQKGIASILIDLPFHGGRGSDATDTQHDITGTPGPDGFSLSGSSASFGFFDVSGNTAAGIPGVLPKAIRSAFFQAVNDIQQAFRLMRAGDLSAIGAREPRLVALKPDATHEFYIGNSFGSMIGTIMAAFEPGLEGAELVVDGGGLIFPLLLNSPVYGPTFGTLLNGNLGTHGGETSDRLDTDWGYNLAQYLLDEGDSLAYAPYVVAQQSWGAASTETDRACHLLQLSAFHDESVPNPANSAVAHGMGLTPLTLGDGVPPDLSFWSGATTASGSLSGNAGGQTAAFVQFHEASHGMLTSRHGQHKWDLTNPDPPFTMLSSPVTFNNPIDRVHALTAAFAEAVLKGQVPTIE